MTEYLSYQFKDDEETISTYDELPLWSAPFGLLLLKYLELKPNLTVLDLGSGTGFPLLELAECLGNSCKLYGIDTWEMANKRVKQKIQNYGLSNVEIIEGSAESIPFGDNTVDLIVSNLGINNFDKAEVVFKECYRVLKPDGKLVLTTNLNGHWTEFYDIFGATLRQLGKEDLYNQLIIHQEHRGNLESVSGMFTNSGFVVDRYFEEQFDMNFVDGSAFLNHHFVKLGWLSSWIGLLPEDDVRNIFSTVEHNLNLHSNVSGRLNLTVPMLYIEGHR